MIEAKVIADSIAATRITTVQVKAPRFLLAQINKHRTTVQSWHSSRAVPIETMIARMLADDYRPAFKRNRRGMQPGETLDEEQALAAETAWLIARNEAIKSARVLAGLGAHKQWANRLLEPFACAVGVITATHSYLVPSGPHFDKKINPWEHMFNLRCAPDAQDEFQTLANAMRDAIVASTPMNTELHVPYISPDETGELALLDLMKVSAMRCARVSYHAPDTAAPDVMADLEKVKALIDAGHWTPMEHVATAARGQYGVLNGWESLRSWMSQ